MEARYSTATEIVADPSWFPDNIDLQRGTIGFVRTSREAISEQPFLDSRWDRSALARLDIAIPTVRAAQNPARPQLNFIWHTAFCCSTLVSQCLDCEGINLSLKEPQILINLAEAERAGRSPGKGAADTVFKLLARGPMGERVLVKPTNAINNLVSQAVRGTDGRMLFLYSDCKSFLVSLAKKGEMGRIFARKLFGLFAADGHAQARWPQQTLFELSDLQVAALVWHMQIAEFRRSLDPARSAVLNCDDFLSAPRAALERLNDLFDLNLPAAHLDATVSGPLFTRDAKNTSRPFNAERRAAEAAAMAKALGSDLDTVIEWSYRACPETPRGDPLGPSL